MLQFLWWKIRTSEEGQFYNVEHKDGHFQFVSEFSTSIREFLMNHLGRHEGFPMLDEKMVDTAMELYQSIKLKSRFDDWNDMSNEVDKIYQQFVR